MRNMHLGWGFYVEMKVIQTLTLIKIMINK